MAANQAAEVAQKAAQKTLEALQIQLEEALNDAESAVKGRNDAEEKFKAATQVASNAGKKADELYDEYQVAKALAVPAGGRRKSRRSKHSRKSRRRSRN